MKNASGGFGVRLKKLRKNAGMTQAELAARLGRTGSAARMWELGVNEPDIATLVELSAIFDCSLDYLLCRDAVLGKEGAVRTNLPVYRLSEYSASAEPVFYQSILPEYLDTGFAYIMLLNDCADRTPGIPPDALVLIRLQDSCLHGQTALIDLRGGILLRKVTFCDGGLILTGAIPQTEPIFTDAADPTLRIVGVAVEYKLTLE